MSSPHWLFRFCWPGISQLLIALPLIEATSGEVPEPFNTEASTSRPLAAAEAAAKWQLPPGFRATAFAAEPDVRQPIAMCLDDRGRLWVAESYMYAGHSGGYFDARLRDRIVILEDTDLDGRHDKRTVFAEGLERLTSIEVGLGGVWALTLPQMVFFPDLDRNDVPDAPATVVLDGFDISHSGHTMGNGLRWGPDGWLYGRQGILGTSSIGNPGMPEAQRTRINVGIWRYHPLRRVAEVVCEGTTNPWGMDWNAHGEAFFINTVIGHLWQVIPGAHYRRMFGEDPNPHTYELIDHHADHVHWDTTEKWNESSKSVSATSLSAGGGHAHTGLMIYQGDNWPQEYRGDLFTINFHGRRLNRDLLTASGSGYSGHHGQDLAFSADLWFRGIDLLYGPDGGVFLSDWSDTGECHDDDGIHRLSGRIYKITHGAVARPAVADVAALATADLLPLLAHPNEWFARRARLQLQQRAAAGENLMVIEATLREQFFSRSEVVHRLRILWALHAMGKADGPFLIQRLSDEDDHVRSWAVRLLVEDRARSSERDTLEALQTLARRETSPRVRLALASALQRLPLDQRLALARPLLAHGEDARDHNLPLMLWYGIEALGQDHRGDLVELARGCEIPVVRNHISRRLASEANDRGDAVETLLLHAKGAEDGWRKDVLEGMTQALKGMRGAKAPAAWPALAQALDKSSDPQLVDLVRTLGLIFADPLAMERTLAMVRAEASPLNLRRDSLRALVAAQAPGLHDLCAELLGTSGLAALAAEGLSLEEDVATADLILSRFKSVPHAERAGVISALINRPAWAAKLLDAVEAGSISVKEISAYQVRLIRGLNERALTNRISALWGEVRESSADKQTAIAEWQNYLTPEILSGGDRAAGRQHFTTLCAGCHTMYGEGSAIGPDLTGGGRDNLAYLLANLIDPSAVVARENQLSILSLKDGRQLSGMIRGQDERLIRLQTLTEKISVPAGDVEKTETLPVSLMPEGLLDGLNREQARDLFSWLMDKPTEADPVPQDEPFTVSLTGDWQVTVEYGSPETVTSLTVEPPIYQDVVAERFASLPLYHAEGGGWNNGAKFAGNIAEVCSTRDLVDPSSVTLRAGPEPTSTVFVRGKDWEMEDRWGTFGRLPGGAIGETTSVYASYRHTSLRLDAMVLDANGKIVLRQGVGKSAAPEAPAVAVGERRVANLWLPGPLPRLTANHVFPVLETHYPAAAVDTVSPIANKFPHLLEKLRAGEPLRILAWGDSVTDAVYLPAGERWQVQFVARLQRQFPAAKIELLSEAWGGRTTTAYLNEPPGSLHNYREKVLALKPDLIISEFVNDAGLAPDQIAPQYGRILADFQQIGASWIILTPHYVMPSWMGLDREREIDEDPRPYVGILRQFAAKHPVVLADAARRYGRLWRQGIPYTSLMVNSINHPNGYGMSLFADALMELFEE